MDQQAALVSGIFPRIGPARAPLPGTCIRCNNSRADFLDTGGFVDFYGAILICVDCLEFAARTLGMDYPPPVAEEEASVEDVKLAVSSILSSLGYNIGCLSDVCNSLAALLPESEQDSNNDVSETSGDSKPKSKSAGKQGSDGVPSNTDNGEFTVEY